MKYNYQIIIEYLGKNFVGWQIQKKGKSIQGLIQKAISKTIKKKIKLVGSGRTDAGVNAVGQSANFFCDNEIKNSFKFLSSVNFFLKKHQISIINLKKKNDLFHARYSAKKRLYEYIIINRLANLSLDQDRSWLIKKKLNIKKMRKAIKYFIGTHDFSALRSSSCSAKSPIRTITRAGLKKLNDKITIRFESESFLQKQVRSMVGCLKYVGESKWKPERVKEVIDSKKRENCAPPAPPEGLYLKKIFY